MYINDKLDKYIKDRLKISAIELLFIIELNYYFNNIFLFILTAYIVISYFSDFTVSGFLLGYKRYWIGEKSFIIYIKRILDNTFFILLLFKPRFLDTKVVWKIKYGALSFDIKYNVYVIKKEDKVKNYISSKFGQYSDNIEYGLVFLFYVSIGVLIISAFNYLLIKI